MGHRRYNRDEICRKGQSLYDRHIRACLEPQHVGQFVAIDVETGDYEVDANDVAAVKRARAKNPGSLLYIVRVGHPTAYRIGARVRPGPG